MSSTWTGVCKLSTELRHATGRLIRTTGSGGYYFEVNSKPFSYLWIQRHLLCSTDIMFPSFRMRGEQRADAMIRVVQVLCVSGSAVLLERKALVTFRLTFSLHPFPIEVFEQALQLTPSGRQLIPNLWHFRKAWSRHILSPTEFMGLVSCDRYLKVTTTCPNINGQLP